MRRRKLFKCLVMMQIAVLTFCSVFPFISVKEVKAEHNASMDYEKGTEDVHSRAYSSIFDSSIEISDEDGHTYKGSLNANDFQIDLAKYGWTQIPRVTEVHSYNAILATLLDQDCYFMPTLEEFPSDITTLLQRIRFYYVPNSNEPSDATRMAQGFSAISKEFFNDEVLYTATAIDSNSPVDGYTANSDYYDIEGKQVSGFHSSFKVQTKTGGPNKVNNNRAYQLLGYDIQLESEEYNFTQNDASMLIPMDPLKVEDVGKLVRQDAVAKTMFGDTYKYKLASGDVNAKTVVMDLYKALGQYAWDINFHFLKTTQYIQEDNIRDVNTPGPVRNYNFSSVVNQISHEIATSTLERKDHHYSGPIYETPVMNTDAGVTLVAATRTNPDLYWEAATNDKIFAGGSKAYAKRGRTDYQEVTNLTTVSTNSFGDYEYATQYAGFADSVSFVKGPTDKVTLGEFCAIARAMMECYGEPVMTEAEQMALVQTYGFTLPNNYTKEINDAIRYMAAKGIIDPTNVDFSENIKFEDMLNLLTRIADPDSRMTFKEIDVNTYSQLMREGFISGTYGGISPLEDASLVSNITNQYYDYFIMSNDQYTNFRKIDYTDPNGRELVTSGLTLDGYQWEQEIHELQMEQQELTGLATVSEDLWSPTFINCGITDQGYYHFKIKKEVSDAAEGGVLRIVHQLPWEVAIRNNLISTEAAKTTTPDPEVVSSTYDAVISAAASESQSSSESSDTRDLDDIVKETAFIQGYNWNDLALSAADTPAAFYEIEPGGGIYQLITDGDGLPVVEDVTTVSVDTTYKEKSTGVGAVYDDYIHYSLDGIKWEEYNDEGYADESVNDLAVKLNLEYTDAQRSRRMLKSYDELGGEDSDGSAFYVTYLDDQYASHDVMFQVSREYFDKQCADDVNGWSGYTYNNTNVAEVLRTLGSSNLTQSVMCNGKAIQFAVLSKSDISVSIVIMGCSTLNDFSAYFHAPTESRSSNSTVVYYRTGSNKNQDILIDTSTLKSQGLISGTIETDNAITLIGAQPRNVNVSISKTGTNYILIGDTLYKLNSDDKVYVKSNGKTYVNARALMGWCNTDYCFVDNEGKIEMMMPTKKIETHSNAKIVQKPIYNTDGSSTNCGYRTFGKVNGIAMSSSYPLSNYLVVVNPYDSNSDYIFYWLTNHVMHNGTELTVEDSKEAINKYREVTGLNPPDYTDQYVMGYKKLSRKSKTSGLVWQSKAISDLDNSIKSGYDEVLGYVYQPPKIDGDKLNSYFEGLYSGSNVIPIVTVDGKYYNVYLNAFKTSDTSDDSGMLPIGVLPSDIVPIKGTVTDKQHVAEIHSDMKWYMDESKTYGTSSNGIYETGSMIPACVGAFHYLRGLKAYDFSKFARNKSNQLFYGTMYCTINSRGTSGYISVAGHVLEKSPAAYAYTALYVSNADGTRGVYRYPVKNMQLGFGGERLTVSMNYGDPNDIVDWDKYTFGRLITQLDDLTTILLLVFLVILPRIAMWCYFILIGIAVMHDMKPIQILCDKFVDPVKILTFGKQDIHTIEMKRLVIQSCIALAIFYMICDGNFINFIVWCVQFGAALQQR